MGLLFAVAPARLQFATRSGALISTFRLHCIFTFDTFQSLYHTYTVTANLLYHSQFATRSGASKPLGGLEPVSNEPHFESELEINDFPQHARWKVWGVSYAPSVAPHVLRTGRIRFLSRIVRVC